MDEALADLVERVRAARAHRTPLCVRAGGTKDFYGMPASGTLIDPRAYSGIAGYEPSELVVTVRCGTPLALLEAELAANGQMLAFEPPHFGQAATAGGCVASGLSGPRRASSGALRDFVLGALLLDGRGEVLRFGGTVMKNVAGYDVARLVAGSLGTLGIVLEASIKVLPIPAEEATLQLEMDEPKALETMNRWAGQPLPVSATCWSAERLSVRLSGSGAAVRAARERIGGQTVAAPAAQQLWREVREQTSPFFEGTEPLWRFSVPPASAPLALAGGQLIEWGGALRWLRTREPAVALRGRASALGGHATRFRASDADVDAFTALAPALLDIHRRLKAQFDPDAIFNRGRMFRGM
ncbi:MAG: glycolate oxidase subunit GlcE [Burkholderiaceae bacterium]|nr:glycolate oxidase subunit GlcE [Burkholderiaceae bacterium]